MRMVATATLALMACIFFATRGAEAVHPFWGFVHAFSEAAMVGGLADWFAVTALFRKPLGLPIPHTAIIPENKDRIADTMAAFLQSNFLIPSVVARRMGAMNIAGNVGSMLAEGQKGALGSRVGAGAAELFAQILESLDPDRLGTQVRTGLKTQFDRLEIAPLLGRMLDSMMADRRHLPLIDSFVKWGGLTLEDNEQLLRDMIQQRANALLRFTGLDVRIANSVLDGLYRLLAEVLVDQEHPLRAKAQEGLEQLANDLQHDPEFQAKVEGWKRELLDNPAVAEWWQGVWERMRHGMIRLAREPDALSKGMVGEALAEAGAALRDDPQMQRQINRFARRTAVGVTTRYGEQIVRLVSETVKRWDASTITSRIENAVGRDLQFIRINGTLVGGLVGVAIHTLDKIL
ncbi:DUF445 domain-containing protein [Alteripontixanthobacter maritimus]